MATQETAITASDAIQLIAFLILLILIGSILLQIITHKINKK